MAIAWMVIWICAGFAVGTATAWALLRHEYHDGYVDGRAEERALEDQFDLFESTALAPLPDPEGFSEPEQEWTLEGLAALRPDPAEPYRFTPEPPPAEHERLAVPLDLVWPDSDMASQLAVMDAQEAVQLAAAARLRAQLTDSFPAVQA